MKTNLRSATWVVLLLLASTRAQNTLHGRGLAGLFGHGHSVSNQTSAGSTGPPRDASPPVNSSCKALPLTKKTWETLNLDQYLKSYPGGDHLTVPQYAASKGTSNFDCGVGNKCHANQLCYPVPAPDWYVLFAIQQWNVQTNAIIRALSYGINFVQAIISSIISALFPNPDPRMLEMLKLNLGVNAGFMMVSNTLMIDIMTLFNVTQFGWYMFFNILNNVMTAAMYGVAGLLPLPHEPEHSAFEVWSHLAESMATYEDKMIKGISEEANKILNSGISSNSGIMNLLANGTYLAPPEAIFLPNIETALKNVTTALFLVKVLRSMDAFVTVGSDICNKLGPNGALDGEDKLSYCDPSGTMYNIVRVEKGKEEQKFPNAFVIENRLGFSTQFLTNASYSCQSKYGGYEHYPWTNTTLPRDPADDCVINFPVCDLRNTTIRQTAKDRGVVSACREAGLPI